MYKYRGALLGLLIVSNSLMTGVSASEINRANHTQPSIELEILNDLCNLRTEAAALDQVLFKIGEQADIRILIDGDLSSTQYSGHYLQIELTKIIRDLTRDYSTVMVYQTLKNAPASKKLSELWVYVDNSTTGQVIIQTDASPATGSTTAKSEREIQIRQIERLEGLTQTDVVETLAEVLAQAEDPLARKRAVSALDEIGGTKILGALESGMTDASPLVRKEVARAFGNVQDQQALLLLGQILIGDQEPGVREAAILALRKHNSPAARSFIQAALKDKTDNVSKLASETLSTWQSADQ